jgi:hypothetical protein
MGDWTIPTVSLVAALLWVAVVYVSLDGERERRVPLSWVVLACTVALLITSLIYPDVIDGLLALTALQVLRFVLITSAIYILALEVRRHGR